jgi:hypothetical protein
MCVRNRNRWAASHYYLVTFKVFLFPKIKGDYWGGVALANRRRRESSRVPGAAQQGAWTQQKNFAKYGMAAAASIAIIGAIVFAITSGTSSGEQGSDAPDFEVSLFQGVEEVGFR